MGTEIVDESSLCTARLLSLAVPNNGLATLPPDFRNMPVVLQLEHLVDEEGTLAIKCLNVAGDECARVAFNSRDEVLTELTVAVLRNKLKAVMEQQIFTTVLPSGELL